MAKTKFIVSQAVQGQVYIPVEGVGTLIAGHTLYLVEDQLKDQAVQTAIALGMLVQVDEKFEKALKKNNAQQVVQSGKKQIKRAEILDTDRPEMSLDVDAKDEDETADFIPLDTVNQNKNQQKSFAWDLQSSTSLNPEESTQATLSQQRSIPMQTSVSKDGQISFEDGQPETKIIDPMESKKSGSKKGNTSKGKNNKKAENILSEIMSDLQ